MGMRVPIAGVAEGSPAYEAGFEAGCFLTSLDGAPIPDILDWRWRAAGDVIQVGYIDLDGDEGTVELEREPGEDWGFQFDGMVFDGIRQCRNGCTFCFIHQLPQGLRPSLYTRDDDFRLSFLSGTFVTLTNLTEDDERRILEQRLSPLHVSIQAVGPEARRSLMGKHAAHGLAALERLLDAGIQCHGQVVLVPGANDGAELDRTLEWAYGHPGILTLGVVPLGYTRFQDRFDHSFDEPPQARRVLDQIGPWQQRALAERGEPWVFAADEFYLNAYGDAVLEHLPDAPFYGDFSLFEDGIGIVRTVVDGWQDPTLREQAAQAARALAAADRRAYLVSGEAQRSYLSALLNDAELGEVLIPLYVGNRYFGGNVNVTGLLTGQDMAEALARTAARDPRALLLVPSIVFNDDGLTLDGWSLQDMERQAGAPVTMVSLSPREYLKEIASLADAQG